MNTNLFHNILNVAICLSAGLSAVLLASGCVQLPTGALDCGASFINPAWAAAAASLLGALKTVINLFRDGFAGLFKAQPPVK